MPPRKLINLESKHAELKREMQKIENTQKATSAILRIELPAAKSQYSCVAKLAELGVSENYTHSLLHIVADRGEAGARLPLLRKVLIDQVSLDDARRELGCEKYNVFEDGNTTQKTGKGYIKEKTDGNAITISITPEGKAAFEATKEAAAAKEAATAKK